MKKEELRQIVREEIDLSFGKTKWEKESDLFKKSLGRWIQYMKAGGDSKLDIMNSLTEYVNEYFNVSG